MPLSAAFESPPTSALSFPTLAARWWTRTRRLAAQADIILAALFCMLLAVTLWGQGGQDDVYITYWPARVLAERGQILSYNGLRLEQSSSLALVIVLALVFKLTPLSMPLCGYVVSLGAGIATLLLAVKVGRRMGLRSRAGLVLVMGTVGCFGYWCTSGMETPLLSATALWYIAECTRPTSKVSFGGWTRLAIAAFLFAAARPEAPLLALGLAVVSVAVGLVSRRARMPGPWCGLQIPCARAAITFLVVGLLFGFRRWYFHAWWPNPALMKLGGFQVETGARYLWDAAIMAGSLPVVLFAAGLFVLLVRRVRSGGNMAPELVGALAAAQLAFVVYSGGDWMTGYRFLALVVPGLILTGFLALESLVPTAMGRLGVAALCTTVNLVFAAHMLHCGQSDGQPLWALRTIAKRFDARLGAHAFARVELLNKVHRRDAVTASELLSVADALVKQSNGRPLYVLSGQAGMIAYYLASKHFGQFKLLDLWSLTDQQLKDCLPPKSIQTSQWGTVIAQDRPLLEHQQITERCGLPKPDIFYNEGLDASLTKVLEQTGYELIYHQFGEVKNSSVPAFFAGQLGADGFVAVRRELAQAAGLQKKPAWRWDLNPP